MDNLDLQVSDLTISRCSKQSSEPIPFDVLIDILSRSSAKSIARYRCVSKIWASLLRGLDFTELFLTRSSSRPRFLFNFQIDDTLFFFTSPQPQNLDEKSSLVAIVNHCTSFTAKGSTGISRPVNGLICSQDLGKEDTATVICNPSTGESLTLPKLGTNRIDAKTYLGFDPVNKQFKVLCTMRSRSGSRNASEEYLVLTLGIGTLLWRELKCLRSHYPLYDGICINGVLYYPASVNRSSEVSIIVCFDVRSEKFSFVNIPVGFEFGRYSTLINYKGRLGAFQFQRRISYGQRSDGNPGFLKLWILKDAAKHIWSNKIYGVPYQWRNVIQETNVYFAGITSNGEFVFSPFLQSDPFYVFFHIPGEETFIKVEIRGIEGFKNHKVHTFLNYIEDVKLL